MVNCESLLPLKEKKSVFSEIAEKTMKYAQSLGASDAVIFISEDHSLSVTSRKEDVEYIEKSNGRFINLTVYSGKSSGSASSSDFSYKAICHAVDTAWHIACNTAPDHASGLPDKDLLAKEFLDFDLYHELNYNLNDMIKFTLLSEQSALKFDNKIINTEGSSFSASNTQFVLGNTLGFLAYNVCSNYTVSSVPIASLNNNMQRDYWYESNCNPTKLPDPKFLGEFAAKRSLQRLSARRIATGTYPVIFEAPVALGLIGALSHAIDGSVLYRKASFLENSLGKKIFPEFIDIIDDPHIKGEIGSSSFDNEGVKTRKRNIISNGFLEGYILSSYTARKLGMISTGNSGGPHNISIKCNKKFFYTFNDLLKKMNRGLLVTELIGHGTNYVTGDYSRGVFGYWINNGEIIHPVEEITIASNLLNMFKNIVAIGSDEIKRGNKKSGSILIDHMYIAGF